MSADTEDLSTSKIYSHNDSADYFTSLKKMSLAQLKPGDHTHNPKTPKPQIINQKLSEIKKCEINICVPSKGMALYNIIIIAQQQIS